MCGSVYTQNQDLNALLCQMYLLFQDEPYRLAIGSLRFFFVFFYILVFFTVELKEPPTGNT